MATALHSQVLCNLHKNEHLSVISSCVLIYGMFFFQQIRQEPEKGNVLNYQLKSKGGRRRWGHVTGSCKGEDMDDYEETDLTTISVLGKSKSSADKGANGRGR